LDSGTTEAFSVPTFTQTFTNADLAAGVLTATHDLSDQYPMVQVYDENDQVIVPDFITATSTSVSSIDLSSYGTIAGTWRVIIAATGGTSAATPTSTTFLEDFVNGDLSSGVLTVTHGLGTQYCNVQVYDNNNDVVQPDDITATSTTVTTIDLTSYGTISGTWRAVVIGPGAYSSNIASDLNLSGQAAEDFAVYDGANWVAKGGQEKIKVGSFTRDTSLASGTQAVTGVGFKPSAIQCHSGFGNNDKVSTGMDDGTTAVSLSRHATPAYWQTSAGSSFRMTTGGADDYAGKVTSFDADGFTITWTKTGSPTGTASLRYMAFR
jgi:hypothetical protein